MKTLETEQAKAVELASKALSAIDSVTAISSWTLGVLGVVIALLGLFGAVAVFTGSKRTAQKVADARLKDYIDSEEGKAFVRDAVREEVKAQLEQRTFLVVQPSASAPAEPSFPRPPERTGGVR